MYVDKGIEKYPWADHAGGRSAKDLLQEQPSRRIITFCSDVDQILGGGISTGQLTEFCESFDSVSCLLSTALLFISVSAVHVTGIRQLWCYMAGLSTIL